MKRRKAAALLMLAVLAGCSADAGSPESLEEQGNETVSIAEPEKSIVTASSHYANIQLELPQEWECSHEEDKEDAFRFGISIWPRENPQAKLGIYFYPDRFGVCGTGLTEEPAMLGELSAVKGTYDGGDWSFFVFDAPGSYVALNEGVGEFDGYDCQAMEILSTLLLGQGVISEDRAIELAEKEYAGDYDRIRASFDYETGLWSVEFSLPEGGTQAVFIDANGVTHYPGGGSRSGGQA